MKKNFEQLKTPTKNIKNVVILQRLDTEMFPIKEPIQPETKNSSTGRLQRQTPVKSSSKFKINIKDMLETLNYLKKFLEQQFEQLLKPLSQRKNSFQQILQNLLEVPTFRIEKIQTQKKLLERYQLILQGLQYITSKIQNNQSLKDYIYIQNCQEFVLFFKSLFSKPYFFCNKDSNRKIIEILWENQLFARKDKIRGLQNLKLWIYGIALPSNPAAIVFHKTVLEHPQLITKCLKHKNNAIISCNINQSDSDGNTPLMLAVRNTYNSVGIEKLVKNGCDIFATPLTIKTQQQKRVKTSNMKNQNQITIQLSMPLPTRKQQNPIEYLISMKKSNKVAELFYFNQIYKIKTIKNNVNLGTNIQKIPDCSFQIDWKIGRGFFQNCVKDVVAIYKQGRNLRVDFHVGNILRERQENQYYTFLIKCHEKPSLYLISHHQKKIVDLMNELISQSVKTRYQKYYKMGDSENQQITYVKATHNRSKLNTQFNFTYAYENVVQTKQIKPLLSSIKQYENQIINSTLINYQSLEKSEIEAAVNNEKDKKLFDKIPKVKSKIYNNNATLDVEWNRQQLNLGHLSTIINILTKFYPILSKFDKIISLLLTNCQFLQEELHILLPKKTKLQSNAEFTIQTQIKNLIYGNTNFNENIFNVDIQVEEKCFTRQTEYEQLNSLKSTVILDEMFSLSVSNFLGKSELIEEQQQIEYAGKFQELLKNIIEQDEVRDDNVD